MLRSLELELCYLEQRGGGGSELSATDGNRSPVLARKALRTGRAIWATPGVRRLTLLQLVAAGGTDSLKDPSPFKYNGFRPTQGWCCRHSLIILLVTWLG